MGENPYYVYKFKDYDVLIMHGDLGCPAMGGELDEIIAMGVKRLCSAAEEGCLTKVPE